MSGQSGASRSPSPHKMLLETSFCGTKPPKGEKKNVEESGTKNEPEDLEKVLLARKHDPTEAILAEGNIGKNTEDAFNLLRIFRDFLGKNSIGETNKKNRRECSKCQKRHNYNSG